MSKKILAILIAAAMLLAAGCSQEPAVSYIDGCVAELGQYKDRSVTVTEAEINERMLKTYREYATYSVSEEGVIAEDSALMMVCSANSGDDAVDRLSFEEQAYYVGYEENLPGFDDAIVGKNIGDTIAFTLTMPSDYSDGSLAGKEVNFEVKATSLLEYPEIDDENVSTFVGEYLGLNSAYELREYSRQSIFAERLINGIAAETTLNHSIKADEDGYREYYYNQAHGDYEDRVSSGDFSGTFNDYCLEFRGMSEEEFNSKNAADAKDYAEKRVIIYAICEAEGLTASDQVIQNYAVNAFEPAGYGTPRDFIKAMGREYLRYEITLSSMESFYSFLLGSNECVE